MTYKNTEEIIKQYTDLVDELTRLDTVEYDKDCLEKAISRKKEEIKQLTEKVKERKEDISGMRKRSEIEKELKESDTRLDLLRQIESLNTTINNSKQKIAEKKKYLADLEIDMVNIIDHKADREKLAKKYNLDEGYVKDFITEINHKQYANVREQAETKLKIKAYTAQVDDAVIELAKLEEKLTK